MSHHTLTASARRPRGHAQPRPRPTHATPGVDITINYHPGFEVTALAALGRQHTPILRAQIAPGGQKMDVEQIVRGECAPRRLTDALSARSSRPSTTPCSPATVASLPGKGSASPDRHLP